MSKNSRIDPPVETTPYTPAAGELIPAPDVFQPLPARVLAAVDLHRRGLNVFPVPMPQETAAYLAATKQDNGKPAYMVQPFFSSRLHRCGPDCMRRQSEGKGVCQTIARGATFETLFERANLAVMMGRTSANLFDIDCDNMQSFERMGRELEGRGLPFWAYRSGRGGHFWMILSEGQAANFTELDGWHDVQVWGHDHYVIVPPSHHMNGSVYEWLTADPRMLPARELPPVVTLADLEFLGVKLARKQGKEPNLYGLPAWAREMSDKNRQRLAGTPEKGARNINLTPVVYELAALVDRGVCAESDALDLLQAYCNRTEYSYWHLLTMWKSAGKRRKLTTAREYYDAKPSVQAHDKARAFADRYDWRQHGRTANSDRAVFLACCERSKLDNSATFRASIREVAELANVNKETAHAALLRLATRSRPLLDLVVSADADQATRYTFAEWVTSAGDPNPYSSITCKNSVRNKVTQNDVFHTQKSARRVWEFLQGKALTIGEICEGAKMHRKTTRRALAWLTAHGLVTFSQAEGLYCGEVKTANELEHIALALDTFGTTEKRERDHTRERETRNNIRLAAARKFWNDRYGRG